MTTEGVLNAYIDANILLAVACLLWTSVLVLFPLFGLKRDYKSQLGLLNGGVLAILLSPIFVYLFSGWAGQHSLGISDIVVAQYLEGNFKMNPAHLESALNLREISVAEFLAFDSGFSRILMAAFATGFVYLLGRSISEALKLRRLIRECYQWKRFGNLYLVVSDSIKIPFSTRSLTRRYIVVPSDMLGRSVDLRIAISHELQHFRQRDVEWEFLLEVLKPVFFWNPIFFIWRKQVRQLREYSCDQMLVARNSYDVRAYCECLLRVSINNQMAKNADQIGSPTVALVNDASASLQSNTSFLRKRILVITGRPARGISNFGLWALAAPLMVAVVTISVLIQSPKDWSQDRLMLSTIVNLERLDTIKEFSGGIGFRTY